MSRSPSTHIKSTPARPSNVHQTEFAPDLDSRRSAVLEAAGPTVPKVDLKLFFKYLLPHFEGSAVHQNFGTVCQAVLADQYADGKWKAFEQDPANMKKENAKRDDGVKAITIVLQKVSVLLAEAEIQKSIVCKAGGETVRGKFCRFAW